MLPSWQPGFFLCFLCFPALLSPVCVSLFVLSVRVLGGVAFLLLLLWAGTAGAAEVNHPSSHTCSISTPVFLPLIARSFRHPQGYLIESGSLGYYLLWTLLMPSCFFWTYLVFLVLAQVCSAAAVLLLPTCPANSYPLRLLDLDPCLLDLPVCSPPTTWKINYILFPL